VKLGVQLKVPEVFPPPGVNVAPAVMADPEAVRELIASPSGSDAVTFTVSSDPSAPDAVAGAETVGARSVLAMLIAVDADPESTLDAVKVTE
jgi:hypothetical protein